MEEYVTRPVKNGHSIKVKVGKVIEQVGPARSGKTIRANAWMAEDPDHRRVVDGDRDEAKRLANQGFDVTLNLYPRM